MGRHADTPHRSRASSAGAALAAGFVALALAAGSGATRAAAADFSDTTTADPDHRIVVGVLPFRSPEGHEDLGSLAALRVQAELAESARYRLVEEESMEVVLAQIAKANTRDFSQEDLAVRAGKLVAARYIAFGEVVSVQLNPPGAMFDCDLSAALRLVRVETGVIVYQKVTTVHGGSANGCVAEAIGQLTCELLKSASLAGIVLEAVDPSAILVDLGSRDGIRAGQRLAVLREGGAITHPVTGKQLRRPDTDCGEIEIVKLGEATSFAKLRTKEGNVHMGDRVLLPITANCLNLGSTLRQAGTPLLKALIKKGIH